MQAYEHSIFLKNEQIIQQELKDRGMEFIEVDKTAFAEKCRQAIFESLSPDNQRQYTTFIESLK